MNDHWHHFGPGPLWLSAVLSGVSLLWWIGLPVLLFWAGSHLLGQRDQPTSPANARLQPVQPSASEMLRRRYVLGEIDALTFEHMLERVMFSEAQETTGQRLYPRSMEGQVRVWEPPSEPQSSDTPHEMPPPLLPYAAPDTTPETLGGDVEYV